MLKEKKMQNTKGLSKINQFTIPPTQAYRVLQKAAEVLGRGDIGTHTMRKTFGYFYYRKTKDLVFLQEIFNHSAPIITKRYIGLIQEEIDESLEDFYL